MQKIKKILFSIFLFSATSSYCFEPMTVIAIAAIGSLITQVISPTKDAYQTIYPTPEQQLNTKIAEEKLKYVVKEHQLIARTIDSSLEGVNAREKFSNCLFASKRESERGVHNCPIACLELAHEFMKCAGKDATIELIRNSDTFKK